MTACSTWVTTVSGVWLRDYFYIVRCVLFDISLALFFLAFLDLWFGICHYSERVNGQVVKNDYTV